MWAKMLCGISLALHSCIAYFHSGLGFLITYLFQYDLSSNYYMLIFLINIIYNLPVYLLNKAKNILLLWIMDSVLMDGINYNLQNLEKDCWNRLLNGSLRYKDAFHNMVVGNVNEEGVNLRTVVLRKVSTSKKELSFNTDVRCGKWQDLGKQNRISFLFYDAAANLQIRLSGTATLHQTDGIAAEAWAVTKMGSRKSYLAQPGPSTIIPLPASGLSTILETTDPTPEESENGRQNFGVIVSKIHWMEWLWLSSKGHRRAVFTNTGNGSGSQNWLIP